jgi:hypothetical protein
MLTGIAEATNVIIVETSFYRGELRTYIRCETIGLELPISA